jgi:hypothetical protein
MTEFIAELYVARGNHDAVGTDAERARVAAAELTREGTPVRLLRSIFVPEDETCFLLYEAASAEAVREAVRRAAIACEHVAETVPCAQLDQPTGGS